MEIYDELKFSAIGRGSILLDFQRLVADATDDTKFCLCCGQQKGPNPKVQATIGTGEQRVQKHAFAFYLVHFGFDFC